MLYNGALFLVLLKESIQDGGRDFDFLPGYFVRVKENITKKD